MESETSKNVRVALLICKSSSAQMCGPITNNCQCKLQKNKEGINFLFHWANLQFGKWQVVSGTAQVGDF